MASISVGSTLSAAWQKVSGSKGTFWAAIFIVFVITMVVGMVLGFAKNSSVVGLQVIVSIINWAINIFFTMGIMYIGIRRAKDMPITYKQVFFPFQADMGLKLIGVNLLQTLLIVLIAFPVILIGIMMKADEGLSSTSYLMFVVGAIMFVLGLYLTLRISLAPGFVLDKMQGPWQAIMSSYAATRHNTLTLLLLYIVMMVFMALSALCLGIPLIWVLPLGYILYGVVYCNLASG